MGEFGVTKASEEAFKEWLSALYVVMQPDLEETPANLYSDPDSWRDYCDDGFTPEEAWSSEKSYWEE
jgi:hypothetical protein